MPEPTEKSCVQNTEIALLKRDVAELQKDHHALEKKTADDMLKLRSDLDGILKEATSFKIVLRTLQVIALSLGAMIYSYIKKHTGWF